MLHEEVKGEEKSNSGKKKVRAIGPYEIHETIGKGGYAWVKRGVYTTDNTIVALKFMKRVSRHFTVKQSELIKTEIKCLANIRHENVLKIFDYNLHAKYPNRDGSSIKSVMLVLEYCPGGELFDILYYAGTGLDEKSARTYFHQLVYGIQAVHKAGIVHRDIKPQNLLLDKSFSLKIADFGLSKILLDKNDQMMKTTQVGTRGFQAPEILKKYRYTSSCDIFSAGVVLFLMLAGYPPFEKAHKSDKWYSSFISNVNQFWHYHRRAPFSEDAKTLLEGMFCYDPPRRITLDEIIKSKWFNKPVFRNEEIKSEIVGRHILAQAKKAKEKQANALDLPMRIGSTEELEVYKSLLELFPAEPMPFGLKPTGLTTFYSPLSPYQAIYSIRHFLSTPKLLTTTMYDEKSAPHTIDCVVNLNGNQYEFSVTAYCDPSTVNTLIHIQSTLTHDYYQWSRYYRTIMEGIFERDILINNLPVCMQVNDDIKEKENIKIDALDLKVLY